MKNTVRKIALASAVAGSSLGLVASPAMAYPASVDLLNTVKIRSDGAIALPKANVYCDPAWNDDWRSISATVTQVINGRVYTASGYRYSDFTCRGYRQQLTVTVTPRNGQPAWRVGPKVTVTWTMGGYNDSGQYEKTTRRERNLSTVRG